MSVVKTVSLKDSQGQKTTYDIGALAQNVVYSSSNNTTVTVKDKIDGYEDIIPSGATSSNKLATANDIPAVIGNPEGSATAGNLTKLKIGSDIYDVPSGGSGNTVSKTRYQISSSNWSSSPNSEGYYTLTATLNPTIGSSPDVYIAGSADGTQPTDTEKGQFAYVKRCKVNGSTLTLYASSKPSSTFYIWVEGVNGTGSGDIVGNVIQPNGAVSEGGFNLTLIKTIEFVKSDFGAEQSGGYRRANSGTAQIDDIYNLFFTKNIYIVAYEKNVGYYSIMAIANGIWIPIYFNDGNNKVTLRLDGGYTNSGDSNTFYRALGGSFEGINYNSIYADIWAGHYATWDNNSKLVLKFYTID